MLNRKLTILTVLVMGLSFPALAQSDETQNAIDAAAEARAAAELAYEVKDSSDAGQIAAEAALKAALDANKRHAQPASSSTSRRPSRP